MPGHHKTLCKKQQQIKLVKKVKKGRLCTVHVLFFMVVTDCTFHLEMSPLNEAAFLNIPSIVLAAPTFHAERSQLKAAAPANTEKRDNND